MTAARQPHLAGSLQERWRLPLPADPRFRRGVTAGDLDGDGEAEIVVHTKTGAVVLKQSGEKIGTLPIPGDTPFLDLGRRPDGPYLIAFQVWGHAVHAFGGGGHRLWSYSTKDAVDWACRAVFPTPEGDGVAIGYNGDGGVRMLNADGTLRWHARGPTNVWSVAAVRLAKDGKSGVACVNDGILVYDTDGRKLREIRAEGSYDHPFSVGAVYGADLDGNGVDEILGLGTTQVSGGYLWVFDTEGKLRWRHRAETGYAALKGPLAAGRFWPVGERWRQVAVGFEDGTIFFFDHEGRPLPGLKLEPGLQSFCTLPRSGIAMDALIAVTAEAVVCYDWKAVPPETPLVLAEPAPPEPPLIQAIQRGDLGDVQALLQQGADPRVTSTQGTPALRMAAGLGHVRIVEALLDAGMEVDFAQDDGDTPLMEAATRGQVEVARLLLQRGADIHVRSDQGITPLISAAMFGSIPIVKMLLQAGAQVNSEDEQGNTALKWAATQGHSEVAELLLAHGATVDHRDWYGATPLMWAAFGGHVDTVKLLLAHGADPHARDDETRRQYGRAQYAGDTETVSRIERSGALRTLQENGRSVLEWAHMSNNPEVLQILREAGAKK